MNRSKGIDGKTSIDIKGILGFIAKGILLVLFVIVGAREVFFSGPQPPSASEKEIQKVEATSCFAEAIDGELLGENEGDGSACAETAQTMYVFCRMVEKRGCLLSVVSVTKQKGEMHSSVVISCMGMDLEKDAMLADTRESLQVYAVGPEWTISTPNQQSRFWEFVDREAWDRARERTASMVKEFHIP